jgi:hypothetical protein
MSSRSVTLRASSRSSSAARSSNEATTTRAAPKVSALDTIPAASHSRAEALQSAVSRRDSCRALSRRATASATSSGAQVSDPARLRTIACFRA